MTTTLDSMEKNDQAHRNSEVRPSKVDNVINGATMSLLHTDCSRRSSAHWGYK